MDPSLLPPATDHINPMPLTGESVIHVTINGIFLFISCAVVGGRFFCRIFMGGGLGADDWLVFAALVMAAIVYIITIMMGIAGSGHPTPETVAAGNLPHLLLMTFVMVIIDLASLALSKMSMLFFYMRVFQGQLRTYCWMAMGMVVAWFVSIACGNIFICTPIAAQWDLTLATPTSCGNQIPLFQALIITNIFTDLVIMALPMTTIWSLNMRKMEKMGVMTSFMFLLAVMVVGVVRIRWVSTVDMRGDLSGTMALSIFLSCIELFFAIICVSVPMLRPLYTRYRAKHHSAKLSEPESGSDLRTFGQSGGQRSGGARGKAGPVADMTLGTFYDSAAEAAQHEQETEGGQMYYGHGAKSTAEVVVGSHGSLESTNGSQKILTKDTVPPGEGSIGVHRQWEVERT